MDNTRFEELIVKAQDGDKQALDELVNDNLRLIYKIAKQINGRNVPNFQANFDALLQEGAIGLIKAIRGFDVSRGFKFSTYAYPKIRGEMLKCLRDTNETMAYKIPRDLHANVVKINKIIDIFIDENGRNPSCQELSDKTGLSVKDIGCSLKAVEVYSSINSLAGSTEGKNIELEEIIPNPYNIGEDEIVNNIVLDDAINSLDERKRKIINLRYYQNKSQAETARNIGISQVQISRLEKMALQELKHIMGRVI